MTQATNVVRFAWAADLEGFRLSSSFRYESPQGQIDSERLMPASLAGFELLVVMAVKLSCCALRLNETDRQWTQDWKWFLLLTGYLDDRAG